MKIIIEDLMTSIFSFLLYFFCQAEKNCASSLIDNLIFSKWHVPDLLSLKYMMWWMTNETHYVVFKIQYVSFIYFVIFFLNWFLIFSKTWYRISITFSTKLNLISIHTFKYKIWILMKEFFILNESNVS